VAPVHIDPLPRLVADLTREYEGLVPREAIDRAAEEALEELRGARLREYVPILARRLARQRLRRRAL
jgi:hypothetical protein